MGWTEYQAKHWKRGRIDRRAECRDYFERNSKYYELLKDTLIGSTWYAAVRYKETQKVFCAVFLTSVRDNYWFAYKDMSDACGPCVYDCPNSILDLLSPTDNEYALEWRETCRKLHAKKNALKKATHIRVTYLSDTMRCNKGETIDYWRTGPQKHWMPIGRSYYTPERIVLQNQYEIIA